MKIELRRKKHVCVNIASSFGGLFCLLLALFYTSWWGQEVTGMWNPQELHALGSSQPKDEYTRNPYHITSKDKDYRGINLEGMLIIPLESIWKEQKHGQM